MSKPAPADHIKAIIQEISTSGVWKAEVLAYKKGIDSRHVFHKKSFDFYDTVAFYDFDKLWPKKDAAYFQDTNMSAFLLGVRSYLNQIDPGRLGGSNWTQERYSWVNKVKSLQGVIGRVSKEPEYLQEFLAENASGLLKNWVSLYQNTPSKYWSRITDGCRIYGPDKPMKLLGGSKNNTQDYVFVKPDAKDKGKFRTHPLDFNNPEFANKLEAAVFYSNKAQENDGPPFIVVQEPSNYGRSFAIRHRDDPARLKLKSFATRAEATKFAEENTDYLDELRDQKLLEEKTRRAEMKQAQELKKADALKEKDEPDNRVSSAEITRFREELQRRSEEKRAALALHNRSLNELNADIIDNDSPSAYNDNKTTTYDVKQEQNQPSNNTNNKDETMSNNKTKPHSNREYAAKQIVGTLLAAQGQEIIIQDRSGKLLALSGVAPEQAHDFFMETERYASYKRDAEYFGKPAKTEEFLNNAERVALDTKSQEMLDKRSTKAMRDAQNLQTIAFRVATGRDPRVGEAMPRIDQALPILAQSGNTSVIVDNVIVGHDRKDLLKDDERRLDDRTISFHDPRTGQQVQVPVLTGIYHSISPAYEENRQAKREVVNSVNQHRSMQALYGEGSIAPYSGINQETKIVQAEYARRSELQLEFVSDAQSGALNTVIPRVETSIPFYNSPTHKVGGTEGASDRKCNTAREKLFSEIYDAVYASRQIMKPELQEVLGVERSVVQLDLWGHTEDKIKGVKAHKAFGIGVDIPVDHTAGDSVTLFKGLSDILNYRDQATIDRLGKPLYNDDGVRVGFDSKNSKYNLMQEQMRDAFIKMRSDIGKSAIDMINDVGPEGMQTSNELQQLQSYLSWGNNGYYVETSNMLHIQNWAIKNPSFAQQMMTKYAQPDSYALRNNIEVAISAMGHMEDRFAGAEALRATFRDHLIANDHFGTRKGEDLHFNLTGEADNGGTIRIEGVNNRGHFTRAEVKQMLGENSVTVFDYSKDENQQMKKTKVCTVTRSGITQKGLFAANAMLHGLNEGGPINERAFVNNAGWSVTTAGVKADHVLSREAQNIYRFKDDRSAREAYESGINTTARSHHYQVASNLLEKIQFHTPKKDKIEMLPPSMASFGNVVNASRAAVAALTAKEEAYAKTQGVAYDKNSPKDYDLLAGNKSGTLNGLSRREVWGLSGLLPASAGGKENYTMLSVGDHNDFNWSKANHANSERIIGAQPIEIIKSTVDYVPGQGAPTATTERVNLNPFAQDKSPEYAKAIENGKALHHALSASEFSDQIKQVVFDQIIPYTESLKSKNALELIQYRYDAPFDVASKSADAKANSPAFKQVSKEREEAAAHYRKMIEQEKAEMEARQGPTAKEIIDNFGALSAEDVFGNNPVFDEPSVSGRQVEQENTRSQDGYKGPKPDDDDTGGPGIK